MMEHGHGWLSWFTGAHHQYMRLSDCMMNDYLWIGITVALDAAVAAGYMLIAIHWWKNQKHLPSKAPARRAMGNMRNIFLFCGICGYVFIPVKMVWPAWRLYDCFLAILVYFTWRYAWGAKDLKVVFRELGLSSQRADDLEKSRQESRHKSFFLNALSHDLRTPLNGLMLQANYAELGMKSGDSEVIAASLEQIKACTRATSDLLDSLLEFAKSDWADSSNKLTTFSLHEAIAAVVERYRPMATEKKLTLRTGDFNGQHIQTDRMKFERIVTNLLSNAIKFTESGVIQIEAQCVADSRANCAEIHVIDSGIGVEPAMRERLFEEFFQVHNHERDPRKGFGLGLAIAKRLVTQLGGEIQLDSAVGAGSRFSIVLPGVVTVGQSTGAGDAATGVVASDQ